MTFYYVCVFKCRRQLEDVRRERRADERIIKDSSAIRRRRQCAETAACTFAFGQIIASHHYQQIGNANASTRCAL